MNNVKPMVGQVWENNDNDYIVKAIMLGICNKGVRVVCDEIRANFIVNGGFTDVFTFIPQNDLEWLAVKVDKWAVPSSNFIARAPSDCVDYSAPCLSLNYPQKKYTRQQWQNKRYELGLDEPKNKITWADCPFPTININCPCALTPIKKETKMIDLSTTKVGDEFVDGNDNIIKIVCVNNYAPKKYVGTINGRSAGMYDKHGKNIDPTCVNIVSRYEPRHWLKDLPDAWVFELYETLELSCGSSGVWFAHLRNDTLAIAGPKMPTLTGEEWKLSEISIPDLKAWQEANSNN